MSGDAVLDWLEALPAYLDRASPDSLIARRLAELERQAVEVGPIEGPDEYPESEVRWVSDPPPIGLGDRLIVGVDPATSTSVTMLVVGIEGRVYMLRAEPSEEVANGGPHG